MEVHLNFSTHSNDPYLYVRAKTPNISKITLDYLNNLSQNAIDSSESF